MRHAAGRDQRQRLVYRGWGRTSIENDLGHLNNVLRHLAVADWVLGDELQESRIAKIVPAFEGNVLMYELGMLAEPGAQANRITCIDQIHSAAKEDIFNAFVVGQVQLVGEGGLFNVPLQPRPAGKSGLPRDGELGIAQLQGGVEYLGVGGPPKARMKFPEPLGCSQVAGSVVPE
jgi:hypothetical protein